MFLEGCCMFVSIMGLESWVLLMLGSYFTTELHIQSP